MLDFIITSPLLYSLFTFYGFQEKLFLKSSRYQDDLINLSKTVEIDIKVTLPF